MKRQLLLLVYLLSINYILSAQISFKQIPPPPPALQQIVNFPGIYNGDVAYADVDGDNDIDLLIAGQKNIGQLTELYLNDGNGNFTLKPGTSFDAVSYCSIAFADVDGDNDQDVLIVGINNANQPIAKLYTNNGNGAFIVDSTTTFEGVRNGSIALADIDGDNDLDVFISGFNASFQAISRLYKNNGSGSFTLVSGTPFDGVGAGSIALKDVDGDNDQDLLITGANNSNQYTAKLYTNDGSGNYTYVSGTPFEGVVYGSIAFADVDGDNDQDVVVTGYTSSFQSISNLYVNNGSGSFSLVSGTPFDGAYNSAVAFADFDGDNDQDILITGVNSSGFTIAKFYTNNGSGTFSLKSNSSVDGAYNGSVAFADFDGDSDLDVLIAGMNQYGLMHTKLYFNDSNGNFEFPTGTAFDPVYQSSIAFADVDGDNDKDVLITGYNTSNQPIAKLYTNDGNGGYTLVTGTPFEGVVTSSIAFADVDGDNDQDVLITGRNSSNQTSSKLYTNDGSANFTLVSGTPFTGVDNSSVAFSDIDGDGDQDVLISGRYGLVNHVSFLYTNNGNGVFSLVTGTPFDGASSGSIAFADVDGDNDSDVILTGYNGSQRISKLYFNNGSGVFSLASGSAFEGVNSSSVAFADIDGDNDQDVIISGINNSYQRTTKLYKNNGSGIFSLVSGTSFVGVQYTSVAFADIDRDNDQDVLITGSTNGSDKNTKLYSNDGNGNFSLVSGLSFDHVYWGSIAFTDVDGDNDQDVLITGINTTGQRIAKLYANTTCIPNSSSSYIVACDSFTWLANGITYTSSGNYIDTLTNVNGCDSVVTLHLTLDSSQLYTEVHSICSDSSLFWHGQNYNTSGVYFDSLQTIHGCDSVYQLTLIVNPLPTPTFTGLASAYCEDAAVAILNGTPSGGTFSGIGVSGTSFDPSTAGTGSKIVIYTYTDTNGCTNSDTNNTVVNPLPVISLPTLSDKCIDVATINLTGATPVNGTWSGPGVTNNSFSPSTAGVNTHYLTYSFTDANGCSNLDSTTVQVNPLPVISLPTLNDKCVDAPQFNLTGATPANGSWSGAGVSNNSFNPSTAGVNTHYLTYSFTDANGCSNLDSTTIQVNPLPSPTFTGLAAAYCEDAAAATLVGTPSGGTFNGMGVAGTSFDPSTAGTGSKSVTYTFTDLNGCTGSITNNTVVNALPMVSYSGLMSAYCEDAMTDTLSALPLGGTWTGTGMSDSIFDPTVPAAGYNVITYTYTDANNCTNYYMDSTMINTLPTISLPSLAAVCLSEPTFNLMGATPANGTWTGNGVSNNYFNAAAAGSNTHYLTYTFTDAIGCTNYDSTSIVVNPLPSLSISGLNSSYCDNGMGSALTGTPAGGSFLGNGVSNGYFDPSVNGAGVVSITYYYTDLNNCFNQTSVTVPVYASHTPEFTGLDTAYCLNDSAVALVPDSMGGVFSGNGIASSMFDPMTAGVGTHNILYTYITAMGCVDSVMHATQVLGLPTVSVSGLANMYCANAAATDTLMVSPMGGTLTGALNGNVFNPSLAIADTINYVEYTYTDANGCSNSAMTSTLVESVPMISLPLPQIVCEDDTITLNLGQMANYTYNWTTGDTTSMVAIDSSYFGLGMFNVGVTVTDTTTGCYAMDSTYGAFEAYPVIPIPDTLGICGYDPMQISAGSNMNYIYNWSTGASTAEITVDTAMTSNTYYNMSVTVTSPAGCSEMKDFVVIFYPESSVDLGADTMICINHIITLDAGAGYDYLWSTGDTTQTIDVDASTLGTGMSNISVVVSKDGCFATDDINIMVNPCNGLDNYEGELDITIYPNPNDGQFTLELQDRQNRQVELHLYNTLGARVYSQNLQSSAYTRESLDLRHLAKGIYYLQLKTKDGLLQSAKVVIR